MAYDNTDSKFSRSFKGTLELDGNLLRYQSVSRLVSWEVDLADVVWIGEDELKFHTLRTPTIVIDSVEAGQRVRRAIAVVGDGAGEGDSLFVRSLPLVSTLQDQLARVTAERAAGRSLKRNFR